MCAIFGIIAKKSDPQLVDRFVMGLSRLQRRGQESAGVAYSNGKRVLTYKEYGLIPQVFTPDVLNEIKGRDPIMIMGQTHYSTSGNRSRRNIPPQWVDTLRGRFSLIHNGNIPNLGEKKEILKQQAGGEIRFDDDDGEIMNDTEFMLRKILWLNSPSKGRGTISDSIQEFMATTNGSYSAVLMNSDGVYVFRDPWGNRPLFIAEDKGVFYIASETCAFGILEQSTPTTVTPGEIITIGIDGTINRKLSKNTPEYSAHCVFENIYFARPDSRTFNPGPEKEFRFKLGQKLAINAPVTNADLVTYMPDSGLSAAEGYACQLHLPNISVYVKDSYVHRTFIHPDKLERERLAKIKYSLIPGSVKDKIIVLIDDSIVRGTTLEKRVRELFSKGRAKEVHVRISAPPVISPCYYGINIPIKNELIAAQLNPEQIRQELSATSLAYLPMDFLHETISESGSDPRNFCDACFSGNYRIPLT